MSQYDKIANIYEKFMGNGGDIPHQLLFDPPLIKLLPDIKEARVLDVGSGNGYWTKRLASKYKNVIGIDNSSNLIKIAREKRSERNIEYLKMDLENKLSFENKYFSFIFSNMVLHYIKNIDQLSHEFYRILDDDGILLFSVTHPSYEEIKHPHLSKKTARKKYNKNALEETATLIMYYENLQSFKTHFVYAGFKLVMYEEVIIHEDFVKQYPRYSNSIGMPRAAVFGFQKTINH